MEIQIIFEEFLEKVVNLNKDRVSRIKDAQRILTDFIKNHETFKSLYIDIVPQGSFRQKTITKPIGKDDTFDVDLLVKLKEESSWSPTYYLSKLSTTFKDSGRYEDITDTNGKTRCVTIDYEGDFHVDLVPAVERLDGYYICNKTADIFEKTDGEGYARWFEQQDVVANGYLVPIVRLIKYLRDSRKDFDTKSIIITTIAGMQVIPSDNFSSLPFAFHSILSRMNEFFSQFSDAPPIPNPVLPTENFNRHWKNDKEGFNRLKTAVMSYTNLALRAISNKSIEGQIKEWQELFGDGFYNDNTDSGGDTYSPKPLPSTDPVIINRPPAKPWCHV